MKSYPRRYFVPIAGLIGAMVAAAAIGGWYALGISATAPTDPGRIALVFGLLIGSLMAVSTYLLLTTRKKAADQQQSDIEHLAMLRNIPGMGYRCLNEENWPMEFISDGCEKLSGYSRVDFESHRVFWGDLICEPDRQRVVDTVAAALQRKEQFEIEYRITDRDGTVRWMWERGWAAEYDGDRVSHLQGFVTDVSSRKLAEDALQRAEAFAKAIVDTAVEAIVAIDANGRIESFNLAAQKMFGCSVEDVLGKNVSILMPKPYDAEHDDYIRQYITTGDAKIIGIGREVNARRRDGTIFPIHLSVSEIFHQSERKFVGLIRDISAQREAERELREQRERLAHLERLNTLGEMATGIAHEINQPLTAISMYAQSGIRFLGQPDPRHDRLLDALEKLSVQAHRAGAIIERMQQMARQRATQHEVVDLNDLINEICKLAEAEAHIREMVIRRKLAPQKLLIDCDPIQIQQVALNFLRNGMEAMQSVGTHNGSHVILVTEDIDEMVKVSVIDSGSGVSQEIAQELFQPFSSTKESGMGMGLSISKSIVTSHGGQIGFVNNQDAGATFYFTLPKALRERQ